MTNEPKSSAAVVSATLTGVHGLQVLIDARISDGPPGFEIVGIADSASRETRDRVRAAFLSSGLAWPLRHLTINITPRPGRTTAVLDLAIALAILAAADELPAARLTDLAALGELGLDGSVRHVRGIVPLVEATAVGTVVVPEACAIDAQLAPGHAIRSARTLRAAVDAARGDAAWPALPRRHPPAVGTDDSHGSAELAWSAGVRRAVEIAAAGGHHLLLVDPPGDSAAAFARCLADLLPPLTADQALETARIHSAAGVARAADDLRRAPLRCVSAPASAVAILGGGGHAIAPGELSLAHNGVLLLADAHDLDPAVLGATEQALAHGRVRVSRARRSVELPARALVVAAVRSCPCKGRQPECSCADAALAGHARRLAGLFLRRFPIRTGLEAGPGRKRDRAVSSALVAQRVAEARAAARRRGVAANAQLPQPIDTTSPTGESRDLIDFLVRAGSLDPSGVDDVLRVARTIADLDGADGQVAEAHTLEAVALRLGTAGS